MQNFRLSGGLTTEKRSRGAHPKVLHFEARYPSVRGPDLVQILEKSVQVVQSFDALIQGVHHGAGVLCEFQTVGLFLFSLQLFEFFEHR